MSTSIEKSDCESVLNDSYIVARANLSIFFEHRRKYYDQYCTITTFRGTCISFAFPECSAISDEENEAALAYDEMFDAMQILMENYIVVRNAVAARITNIDETCKLMTDPLHMLTTEHIISSVMEGVTTSKMEYDIAIHELTLANDKYFAALKIFITRIDMLHHSKKYRNCIMTKFTRNSNDCDVMVLRRNV